VFNIGLLNSSACMQAYRKALTPDGVDSKQYNDITGL